MGSQRSSCTWLGAALGMFLAFGIASPAHGAIAFDALSSYGTSVCNPCTWTHTVTTGGSSRILVVAFTYKPSSGQTISGVSYNGLPMSHARTDTINNQHETSLWYLVNPPTGAALTVSVASTSNMQGVIGAAFSFTGVNQVSPIQVVGGATGTSLAPTVDLTTFTDAAWIVDAVHLPSATPVMVAKPGRIERWNLSSQNQRGAGSTLATTTAGTYTMDWTLATSQPWAISVLALTPDGVTAVELESFDAHGVGGGVELRWRTASELRNLGFHVYRSVSEKGPFSRITSRLVAGLGSSPSGAEYTYVDSGLDNGVTYFYMLEDVETTGATKMHGPVSASPGSGASATLPSGTPDSESSLVYGDPSGNRLRIVEQDRSGVTLELLTRGFRAEPQPDGTVRLDVAGLEQFAGSEDVAIPVKRTWVEALAGRKVQLVSVEPYEVEAIDGLRLSGERPELEADGRGTVRASRRRSETRLRVAGFCPEYSARVVSVGFQGEVKKALVEMAPVRWDGSAGRLMLSHRLVVRLGFRGREPAETLLGGGHGRRFRQRESYRKRGVATRLVTVEPGLYRVRFEEVFGTRRRGFGADEIRLTRQGRPVAFHVEADISETATSAGSFGPGASLYFVSEGAKANPYGREAVYEMELGSGGETMPVVSAPPAGWRSGFYWKRLENEEDRFYQAGLVDAPDIWLWDVVLSPETKGYSFEVESLAQAAGSPRVSVWLQGASDFPVPDDHHVRIYVNDVLAAEAVWDGKRAQRIDAELPPGLLREGGNQLEIENVGDGGAPYSMVMLDRYRVEYPRVPVAEGGTLRGSWRGMSGSEPQLAEVTGLGAGSKVFAVDVSGTTPAWVTGVEVTGQGAARFGADAGDEYVVVGAGSILHPELRWPRASNLKDANHQADYLVIAPQEFLDAAAPLVSLRRSEGLRVKAVSTEAIFSEFGFGETSPQAIQDFLAYAYQYWRAPSIRYVLLLGDGTYDFKDYLGTGVVNRVPPFLVKTSYLWTASDPTYAAVNGDDPLPDIAIGRLPAANVEEARELVDKVVTYEHENDRQASDTLVLVTDNPDAAGDFEADAERIASDVLLGRSVRKIYLSRLGTTATRQGIREAFDEGASVVSYIGHGGIHLWADEDILDIQDVASLEPQTRQPLLLTMNCLNGYFHFPYFNSLAEELVKARGKGAIAAFSPSGLSVNGPAGRYHRALLDQLLNGHHERLGDAVLAAQRVYAETGAFPELLSIYHLLGDPALRLR